MRIGLVTEYFPHGKNADLQGGVEARAFFVSKHLARSHDVTVITSRIPSTPRVDEFLGIKVIRVGKEREYPPMGSIAERLSFIREGRKIDDKFDIVEGSGFLSYPVAWAIARRRVPCVATYHDVWIGEWIRNMGLKGVFGEILERHVLSKDWSWFISVSNTTKEKLVSQGVAETKISVIPNGIELKEHAEANARKYSHPTVCCISRLVKYKRIQDLIKALKVVKEEVPDIRCRIVGMGPERRNLERLVSKLGLRENVEFLGFVERHEDVIRILKGSHVFVLPSVVEGSSIVLLEAMISKVPYVASDIPSIHEVTQGGRGGLLFNPGDYLDLSSKILNILRHGIEKKAEPINMARWDEVARGVESIYKELVK